MLEREGRVEDLMVGAVNTIALPTSAVAALSKLCGRYHVRTLDLFGSAVGDRFDGSRSDLDFLVTFGSGRTGHRADDYFGLHESLEQLFGRHVDLLVEGAIENPFLRRSIERERQLLFP